MMDLAIIYAVLFGLAVAFYGFFQKVASTNTTQILGAAIISTVAFLVNLLILAGLKLKGGEITFSTKGLTFVILAGISAAFIDLFGLYAYSKGLQLSSSPIVGAITTLAVLILGVLYFKESLTLGKLVALGLISLGTYLLSRLGASY